MKVIISGDIVVKFKYNINNTKNSCIEFKKNLKSYSDNCDKIYSTVKNSKNLWISSASNNFNDIIIKDELVWNDIKDSLNKYIDNIYYFSKTLENIFLNRGIYIDKKMISYDSVYIDSSIDKLGAINDALKNCLSEFESVVYPNDFDYTYEFNNLYRSLSITKNNAYDIYDDLRKIKKEINTLYDENIKVLNNIDIVLTDNKVTRVNVAVKPIGEVNN